MARLSAALDPSDGVVTVNIAYRLGGLGYMAMPELTAESQHGTSGNYGMLDQIAALKWIGVYGCVCCMWCMCICCMLMCAHILYMSVHACMFTFTCVHNESMRACMYLCVHVCLCVYAYVYMGVCIWVYAYVYMHLCVSSIAKHP